MSALTPNELIRRAAHVDIEVPFGAQARVWRKIEKRRARAAWRLAFPMFALGAVTAAVLLVWMRPKPALIASSLPRTEVKLPLAAEPAAVELGTAGRVVVGAETVAQLDRFDAGGVEISLKTGSLLMHVRPRTHGEAFIVRTPGFSVRVVGTVFRVTAGPKGPTLAVGHGTVELTRPGAPPLLVRSGEHWPAGATDAPTAAELALLDDAEGATFAPSESQLYAGGLQRLRAHDARGALAAWREQRARYPEGVLGREARASIIDALVLLRDDAQARAEVDAYLRESPRGLRAPEMHFVRGTLLYASDHDCRRAAAEYDVALQHPAEPWAERARAARAACRRR